MNSYKKIGGNWRENIKRGKRPSKSLKSKKNRRKSKKKNKDFRFKNKLKHNSKK